jgi:hypothetical protein
VRGPAIWPAPERVDADRRFIALLLAGKIGEAKAWFPDYAKEVVAEMGSRVLAFFLGALEAMGGKLEAKTFGAYCQSSASGNQNLSLKRAA